MPTRFAGCVTAAALLAGTAGAEPPAAPAADVVVTARERTVVEQFVRDLTDTSRTDQIPVWERQICPGVVGLTATQAVVLNRRIGEVARLVDLADDRARCRPNVLIIVSEDAAKLAAGFARSFPNSLARDGRGRVRRFVESSAPVRWIGQTDIAIPDGDPVIVSPGGSPVTGRLANSRIQQSTRAVIGFMLIIVDAKRLSGTTLGELGEYLGMVAVARPPLDAPAPRDSVLSLFAADGRPRGLTERDRSYLAALYRAPVGGTAQAQRAAIRARMVRSPRAGHDRRPGE